MKTIKMQKIRSKLRISNICVEAENERWIKGLIFATPAPVYGYDTHYS